MILDMDKYSGLKGAHPEDKGPDMSSWFRKACNEGGWGPGTTCRWDQP